MNEMFTSFFLAITAGIQLYTLSQIIELKVDMAEVKIKVEGSETGGVHNKN